MLVLSRKVGEEIVIGDAVRIQVIDIQGNRVRLGITAPAEVSVHRSEVLLDIVSERRNLPERCVAGTAT